MPNINEQVIPKNIEKQKLVGSPWWQEYQSSVNKSSLSLTAQGKLISVALPIGIGVVLIPLLIYSVKKLKIKKSK